MPAEGIFDTHAHLYDGRYPEEGISPEDVLFRAAEAGVTRILIPADNEESSLAAMEYVKDHDGTCGVALYCSVGVHPHEASSYNGRVEEKLISWLGKKTENKIMALGEIGLDYHYDLSPRDVQREVFARQIPIARDFDLPIILHEREATADTMDILKRARERGELRKEPGVCHCCSTSPEIARELVKMGFYIGFDGPITFKNNKKTPAILEAVPMERVVIETDSPYLAPVPMRGKTNEPAYVLYVAEKIAELKGMTAEQVMEITCANGKELYGIK